MRNYNWIVDIIFAMFMALFFLLVTSDIIAEDTKQYINVSIGSDSASGYYDKASQQFVLKRNPQSKSEKVSFKDILIKHGIELNQVVK